MARLAELRIRGLRTLADVILPLGGLTVLIGDNGTGKSSLLEALRIAQLIGRGNFIDALSREHMLGSAIRKDASGLKLDLRVEADGRNLVYSITVEPNGPSIVHEAIHELPAELDLVGAGGPCSSAEPLLLRAGDELRAPAETPSLKIPRDIGVFEYLGRAPRHDGVALVRWSGRRSRASMFTSPSRPRRHGRPERRGGARPSGIHGSSSPATASRCSAPTSQTSIRRSRTRAHSAGERPSSGGHLGLSLELRGLGRVPAFQLADGQLTYLAFVALAQLNPGRSLLAFDEPEHHLHPALLGRVVQLFEEASASYPVILSTHSDRLLDLVADPAATVRVCELQTDYRTRLRKLDAAQLSKWMERYRGLGDIRAAGQLRSILAVTKDSAA